MVVAKKVVILGFVISIIWRDGNDDHILQEWPGPFARTNRDRSVLTSNANGTALYFLPWSVFEDIDLPRAGKAEKDLFKKWSSFVAESAYKATIGKDTLFKRGTINKIIYESDKWNDWERYEHTYTRKPPAKLYTDRPESPIVYGILDQKGKKLVSPRGLIG